MNITLNVFMDKRSRKTVTITSIVLILAGITGIAVPHLMSIAIAMFAGWLMVIAGSIALLITWHGFRDSWVAWLKPFALIAVGLLILLHPIAGTAALGLMLAIYFLLDGFSGVGAAWELRPRRGWGLLMLNGLLSLVLAFVFIAGWPFTTTWLVGLFIGFSLFIDGLTLLMLGLASSTE
jgi:uncharacterized membrane protein HdeD (DUF308 family)